MRRIHNYNQFQASFVEDAILFRSLLMSGSLKVLRECKFVECDALTSEVLQHLSEVLTVCLHFELNTLFHDVIFLNT